MLVKRKYNIGDKVKIQTQNDKGLVWYDCEILDSTREQIYINGEYENHAHLTKTVDSKGKVKLDTAKALINIVTKKRVPKSNYLVTSAIRLTTDEEYKENLMCILDKRKNKKYINTNKGVRR